MLVRVHGFQPMSTPRKKPYQIAGFLSYAPNQGETDREFVSEMYLKRLAKIVAELAAMAAAVVLLQLFVDWLGFETAWPILLGALLVLIVIIARMRE